MAVNGIPNLTQFVFIHSLHFSPAIRQISNRSKENFSAPVNVGHALPCMGIEGPALSCTAVRTKPRADLDMRA